MFYPSSEILAGCLFALVFKTILTFLPTGRDQISHLFSQFGSINEIELQYKCDASKCASNVIRRQEFVMENRNNTGKKMLQADESVVLLSLEEQKRLYAEHGMSQSFISEIESSLNPYQFDRGNREQNETPTNSAQAAISKDETSKPPPLTENNMPSKVQKTNVKRDGTKKPFLKRGEGLTTRFKVNPDKFKLENLPKYKFARRRSVNKENRPAQKDNPQQNEPETNQINKEASPSPKDETLWRHKLQSRKSCLKAGSSANTMDSILDSLASNIERFHVDDDTIADATVSTEKINSHEKRDLQKKSAQRMLEFHKRTVTFDSEVRSIPFENYFLNRVEDTQEANIAQETHEEDEENSDNESEAVSSEHSSDEGDHPQNNSTLEEEVSETIQSKPPFEIPPDYCNNLGSFSAFSSTPVENFKTAVTFAEQLTKSPRTDLIEKGSILRTKLKELEQEIEHFRDQNRSLIKQKQCHELEKLELENRKQELEEQMNDQKIKMEIYFHDERIKIAEEKAKLDSLAKKLKAPSKVSKDELKQLREKVDELEKDIKGREVRHGASQSRLRTQIRNLEKEVKEQSLTVESLKKENKKLESENIRLRRQGNTKMLQEINKNIAKLAPAAPQAPDKNKESEKLKSPEFVTSPPNTQVDMPSDSDSSSIWSDTETDNLSAYFPGRKSIQSAVVKIPNEQQLKRNANPEQPALPPQKREILNPDGSKDIWYPNGNLKKVSADEMVMKTLFFNKDIKETNINEGTVKYYYAEKNIWHTSYIDGLEIFEFPNGQTEHRHKNGKIEIYFPNGSIRITNPKDKIVAEEWRYPDGTTVIEKRNKEKIISMPNGQKEIHSSEHKKLECPDGTIKFVYQDGRQETRYSNGRIRMKDKAGNLIMDTEGPLTK